MARFDIDDWLLPGQHRHDWQPSTPIELLPALHKFYPRCILDDVLSVRLAHDMRSPLHGWHYVVNRPDAEIQVSVVAVTEDDGDGYNYGDAPATEYPDEIVVKTLDSKRFHLLHQITRIFKTDSFDLLTHMTGIQGECTKEDCHTKLQSAHDLVCSGPYRWLLPGQGPEDWKIATPIELLPALRQAYPRCINEDVLSIRLASHKGTGHWYYTVTKPDAELKVPVADLPCGENNRDNGRSFGELPATEYPHAIICNCLDGSCVEVLQINTGIFTADSMNLLARIMKMASELSDERHEPFAASAREAIALMAEHVAGAIDLKTPVIAQLKRSPPWEQHGEHDSAWTELGAEMSADSLLGEMFREQVLSIIYDQFNKLSSAARLALWVRHVREDLYWLTGIEPAAVKLSDLDDFGDRLVSYVCSRAGDDYHDRCKEA